MTSSLNRLLFIVLVFFVIESNTTVIKCLVFWGHAIGSKVTDIKKLSVSQFYKAILTFSRSKVYPAGLFDSSIGEMYRY